MWLMLRVGSEPYLKGVCFLCDSVEKYPALVGRGRGLQVQQRSNLEHLVLCTKLLIQSLWEDGDCIKLLHRSARLRKLNRAHETTSLKQVT